MSGDHNQYQKPYSYLDFECPRCGHCCQQEHTKGKYMSKKGLFDDIPISSPDRDKAWAALIKRRDVKAMMKGKEDFKFPADGSYDLWCIAWEKAWREGFYDGWKEAGGKIREP